jgi:TonB-linked SusC/RagA family outer membrane protein
METAKWKSGILGIVALMMLNLSEVFSAITVYQEMTLLEAIEQISEDYEVYFTFDKKLISDIKVNYDRKENKNVEEAISSILKETTLTYKLFNQQFLVIYKNDEEGLKSLKKMSKFLEKLISDEEKAFFEQKNVTPKTEYDHVSLVLQTINGRVVNESGESLIGVTILIKGTDNGTATDLNGNFRLEDVEENAVLVISYIGYLTQEITVGNKSALTVTLIEDSQNLEEVVVVGYGTQKKTSLTSAVSSLKGEEIASVPLTNLGNSLGGRLSGIIVKQNSGEPGRDGSNIFIRGISTTGSSQPLLIVDGIPRDFQQLDPNSIESFTILKDAAAVAPYGVAGANGVILVTTKKGQAGKPTITYNGYVGFQNPTVLPDYINGEQYAILQNTIAENSGLPIPFTEEEITKFREGSDPDVYPPYYNIWDDILKKNSIINYQNVEVSGGSEDHNYYVGLGYQFQQGMWKWNTTNADRFNLVANIQSKITNTTNLILNLNGIILKSTRPPSDQASPNGTTRLMEQIGYSHPGRGVLEYSNGMFGRPVIPILNGEGGYFRNNTTSIYSQLSIEQDIPFVPGLQLTGTIAYDPSYNNTRLWATPIINATVDASQTPYVYTEGIIGQQFPSLNQDWVQSKQTTFQGGFNYKKTLGPHIFNLLGVFEARSNTMESLSASRRNYALFIDEINMGSSNSADMTTGGSSSVARQIGLVYRLTYDYLEKYLFEASGRYDGHYYFAPDKRFGFFPAFSAGWRLSEEPFLKGNFPWLDNLKLRASYGQVGALAGSPFQYLSTYSVSGPGYVIGGNAVQVINERAEPNPNITWERANKTDIGIEFSLWNGSVNLEADYFYEKRSNMLVAPDVITPMEYGIGLSQVNSGIMENRGIDLSGEVNHSFSPDFNVSLSGTFTYAKNKILQIYENTVTYNNINRRRTGKPLGTQFGFKDLGFFQIDDFDTEGNLRPGIALQPWGAVQPGDIRYEDVNNDGKIDDNDQVAIGDSNQSPRILYGFSPRVQYKNWSLDVLFQGAGETNLYHQNEMIWAFFNGMSAYVDNMDHWSPENPNAKHPRLTGAPTTNNRQFSSFWMRDASYLRLKNATLSFQIPVTLVQKLGVQSARIYASGQNLLTWTKMIYWDPESNFRTYPQQKVTSLGLNVTF